jgi:hypothetical protein
MPDQLSLQPAQELQRSEPSIFDLIREVTTNKEADVSKLERLIALQERAQAQQAKEQFFRAMLAAQKEMPPIVKDTKSETGKYVKLETIQKVIRPIYMRHGFCMSFGTESVEEGVRILCNVMHEAGHVERYIEDGPLDSVGPRGTTNKTPIHATTSTVSYLQKRLTCLIWNLVIADTDKDGDSQLPGGSCITQEQGDNLRDFVREVGLNPQQESNWLKMLDAKTIPEIPATHYMVAYRMLQARAAAKGGK